MHRWCFGLGMQSLPQDFAPLHSLPLTPRELARMGIPARKIPRVRRELARFARLGPALADRRTLLKLARHLAALLP